MTRTRLIGLLVVSCALVFAGVARADYASLTAAQQNLVQQAADGFGTHWSAGEFVPSAYTTADWEKYQSAAVADAVLGGSYASTAQATVDQAIAVHQLPNGDFDAGTVSAGSSGVNGTFWGEAEGEIALLLAPTVSAAENAAWVASMERYASYLWQTQIGPPHEWYINGNVQVRETVILLEAWLLSNDPKYLEEYQISREFLTVPGAISPAWGADGWKTGWFTESLVTRPNTPLACANGMIPCDGFDPNYTTAQLFDSLVAYTLDPSWLPVVQAEYATLAPRVNTAASTLDGTGGSRKSISSEPFYPPVWTVTGDLTAWAQQQQIETIDFAGWPKQANPGPSAYAIVQAAAVGLILAHLQASL